MMKIITHSVTIAVIYISLFQEGAALQQEYGGNQPQAGEKADVMEVATNEENNDVGKSQNSYQGVESGLEKQHSQSSDQETLESEFNSKGSQAAAENVGAKQQEAYNTASKQTSNEEQQEAEMGHSNSEASGKYDENAGAEKQVSYSSTSTHEGKEHQQTDDDTVSGGNTDIFHKRFRQEKKFTGNSGFATDGSRWKMYGSYHLKRPFLRYRKKAMWCKLNKAKLRYLLMGHHKRHIGHFLPFNFRYPDLKKHKSKTAYSEEHNHNRNININKNINLNHKAQASKSYQHSHDTSAASSTKVDQPKYAAKTSMESNAYDVNAQSQGYDKSDNLQQENANYTSDTNQNKNAESSSQARKQQYDNAKYYSGANQNKNAAYSGQEEQGTYNDKTHYYKGDQYTDGDEGNELYSKNGYEGNAMEGNVEQYKNPDKSEVTY